MPAMCGDRSLAGTAHASLVDTAFRCPRLRKSKSTLTHSSMSTQYDKLEQTGKHPAATDVSTGRPTLPSIVPDLAVLVEQGARFPTIYADPP